MDAKVREPFTYLMLGDCLQRMKEIPDGYVDMVMCDLPYQVTDCSWDTIIPFEPLWEQYKRLCTGAIVLTASQPFTSKLVMSNLKDFKYSWIWQKNRPSGHLNAKRKPMSNHEDVLIFGQAKYNPQGLIVLGKKVNNTASNIYAKHESYSGIQEYTNYPRTILPIDIENKKIHPTQQPVALMEYLIKTYTNEGMTVLDNCMGSGTTGVACVNTGRNFIGIEMDQNYFAIASKRIEEAKVK